MSLIAGETPLGSSTSVVMQCKGQLEAQVNTSGASCLAGNSIPVEQNVTYQALRVALV